MQRLHPNTATDDLDSAQCLRALQARDARFDGRFFTGVKTTGIFCRPICAVRAPKPANVVFFRSSAAALEAGFRPCLRCRPEAAPGTPAWSLTSATVSRALRLIDAGALNEGSLEQLAERLGVSTRHLARLFQRHVGASPKAVAQSRRLHLAKKLLDETAMPITAVAYAAGYRSLRRFNDHFLQVYGRAPGTLRRDKAGDQAELTLNLPYREPFCWPSMLAFLALRAVPGVEWVATDTWHRNVRTAQGTGHIEVSHDAQRKLLRARLQLPVMPTLAGVVERLRAVFDLNADPQEIHTVLRRDSRLRPLIDRNPGLRLPGAFDGFETAVRAIVGQQISVPAATRVMGQIASRAGADGTGQAELFPTPQQVAAARIEDFPMPRARARAIVELASGVASGSIDLGRWADAEALREKLLAIKGIGPWTATYIAMRVLGDPDAFLHTDLVLRKVAARVYGDDCAASLLARAEAWRPWRAYAAIYLWRQAADNGENP